MRILHTSDWHLGRNLEQISRIEEQKDFVDCLCKIAEEQKIDLVLLAGDIFDTFNPSAAAEELFYEAMDKLNDKGRRAIVVIAGNHDNPERLCAASPLAYKNGIVFLGYPGSNAGEYKISADGIKLIDSGAGWMELYLSSCQQSTVIITLPYPSEARLEEVLSKQADEGLLQKAYSEKIESIFSDLGRKFRDDTVNLAVAHLFLIGGKSSDSERTLQVGGAMTVNTEALPEKAHYIALGHLHRPQEISNELCKVFYSGSPLAYSFSEADYSKSVYVIDAVPGQKAEVKTVYLDCGRPLRKWVAESGIGQALQWCEDGRDKDAWVDLEIATDRVFTMDEQKQLRRLHPGIINIRPKLKALDIQPFDSQTREGRKIDELFGDYYKYRMGMEIPDELMEAFLEVLHDKDEISLDTPVNGIKKASTFDGGEADET